MEKNSFTLFETLLSITLLIVIVNGFLNSSYYDEKSHNISILLNSLENNFDTNNYSDLTTQTTTLTIIKNLNTKEQLIVKKHLFENDDIKIFKYEK